MANSFSKIVSPANPVPPKQPVPRYSQQEEFGVPSAHNEKALTEGVFHSLLTQERRRADRSRNPFVLMLLDANLEDGTPAQILRRAADIVLASKRETDLVGWYRQDVILGVIFTEVNVEGEAPVTELLRAKIETALIKHLGRELGAKIAISLHLFPESFDKDYTGWVADSKLYPDLKRRVS
jgi:GGDEF domain-containing protein